MAEISFNNKYNQMNKLNQQFYDSYFEDKYDSTKPMDQQSNSLTMKSLGDGSTTPDFAAMQSAYADAQKSKTKNSFFSMSADAAEMPQVPNVSLGTPLPNFNTGITGASSAIPNINGVPMINTGAINQKLQNTDLVSQIIAANASQVPQINNQVNSQVPFNDYYGPNIDTSFGVANEEDEEQGSSLSSMGRKFGLSSLLGLVTGNPIIGLLSKGIGAIRGGSSFVGPKGSTGYGNDSAMSLFRRSNTGAQFFQGLRDKRAREDAAKRGAAKQKDLARINAMRAISGNSSNGGGGGGNPGTTTGGSSKDSGTGGSFGTSSNNNSSFSDYS